MARPTQHLARCEAATATIPGRAHLSLAQLMQQRLDHAQRLVVGCAALPDLVDAQCLEELVHAQQHRRKVHVLGSKQTAQPSNRAPSLWDAAVSASRGFAP
jgi:hypothetical protein